MTELNISASRTDEESAQTTGTPGSGVAQTARFQPTALVGIVAAIKRGALGIGLCLALGVGTLIASVTHGPLGWIAALSLSFAAFALTGGLGWLAEQLIRELTASFQELTGQVEARRKHEEALLTLMERLATALETTGPPSVSTVIPSTDLGAEIREAIREGLWHEAEAKLRALRQEAPDDPRIASLTQELAIGREDATQTLQAKLSAAREVGDTDRVLELHEALIPLLAAEAKSALDKELASWLMGLIHKRLRSGSIGPDLAILSGKVAERFETTAEGASLRAALPTLRRSAGLCARCCSPYKGVADACPKCLGVPEPEDTEDDSEAPPEDPYFITR